MPRAAALPPKNLLDRETSPYLRQHRDNPVHWRGWNEAALDEAQRLNKPILLSVGYAACHWCHVMAHESFENPAIAAEMNRLFVNIKVDREERPDLDDIYMRALQALGQAGGWPLTMFLMPDGAPFWGGTYFPPRAHHGLPGFPQVLQSVAQFYHARGEDAAAQGKQLRAALGFAAPAAASPDAALPVRAAQALVQRMDAERGGIMGAPKFPQFLLLEWLWRVGVYANDAACRARARTSLTRICQGGIYDHLGGGLCRYAVDADWVVPHFEKMLNDNALFLRMLALVWSHTKAPLFAARARETVAWLEREMQVSGAFAASLDADSEGEEGKFYVWSHAELHRVLGGQADGFAAAYGASREGNFEGANVLHVPSAASGGDAPQDEWAQARRTLLAARQKRAAPARDHKLLADWNGLMIAALCDAARAFAEPAWLALARRAFDAMVRHCGDGARMHHVWCDGRRSEARFADDLTHMSLAALRLYGLSGERAYLERAHDWMRNLDEEFWDEGAGCYHRTPANAPLLLVRPPAWQDDVSPSANAAALRLHHEMFLLDGEPAHKARADALEAHALRRAATHYPSMAAALDAALARPHYVSALLHGGDSVGAPPHGGDDASGPLADAPLWRALYGTGWPDILPLGAPEHLPPDAAAGKGGALALCLGRSCLPPITDAAEIAPALGRAFPRAALASV